MRLGWRRGREAEPDATIEKSPPDNPTGVVVPKDAMAAIVTSAAPTMKTVGYRKRHHTFNRSVGANGFVHVLSFQMGSFDPPGTVEIPGLRPNLYGRFTVNLGVFVPAIHRAGLTPRDWYSDYHCQLRKRIGELLPEQSDVWWRLNYPDAKADVIAAIEQHGLPWLDRIQNYAELLDVWESDGGRGVGLNHPAAPLDIADVLLHLGRRPEARGLLENYVDQDHAGGHAEVLRKYLVGRDFAELASHVTG